MASLARAPQASPRPAVLLVTHLVPDPKTGRDVLVVSHGVDLRTDRPVITDNEPLSAYKASGAFFHEGMGEWCLPEATRPAC